MRIGTFTEYRGYIGSIKYDLEDKFHYGSILNTDDLISYYADTIEELYEHFHNAVDVYIKSKSEIVRK